MRELRWRAFRRASWAWLAWERVQLRLHQVTPVSPGSLFGFHKNEAVIELHLDNRALTRMREMPGYTAFKVVHRMREDLALLARRVRSGELGDVTEIVGTSLMGEAGGVLGFETRPVPRTIGSVLQQYFFAGLDAIYHPRGLRARATRRWPVTTRMSVDALIKRYA
jgi:YkoP-like protein